MSNSRRAMLQAHLDCVEAPPPIDAGKSILALSRTLLGYYTSDSLLYPTRGFRNLGRVGPEASLRDGTIPYIRNIIREHGKGLAIGLDAIIAWVVRS